MSLSSVEIKIVVPTADAESAILGNLLHDGQSRAGMMAAICGQVCMPPSVCRSGRCPCGNSPQGEGAPQAVAFVGRM